MKEWEARMLGFTGAWWMLGQVFIPGPAHGPRIVLGLLGLFVGGLASLAVAAEVESRTIATITNWFLLGIASMLALIFGVIILMAVLSLGATLLSL